MSNNTSNTQRQIQDAFGLRLSGPTSCQYLDSITNDPCCTPISERVTLDAYAAIQRLARQSQLSSAPQRNGRVRDTQFIQELQRLAKHVLCPVHTTALIIRNVSLQWLAVAAYFPHWFRISPALVSSLQHLRVQLSQIADNYDDNDASFRQFPQYFFDRAVAGLTRGHCRRIQSLLHNIGHHRQQYLGNRRQNQQNHSRNTSTTPALPPPVPDRSPYRNSPPARNTNSLPDESNSPHRSSPEDDCELGQGCPICSSSWGGEPLVACNTCRQVFHEACINTWARHQRQQTYREDATCPCCRSVWHGRSLDQEGIEDNGSGSDSDTEEDAPFFPESAIMSHDREDLLDRGHDVTERLRIGIMQMREILIAHPPDAENLQWLESYSTIANQILRWLSLATRRMTVRETEPDHVEVEIFRELLDIAERIIRIMRAGFDWLY